jgi:hypothetical protein
MARIQLALILFFATWCTSNAIKCVGFDVDRGELKLDSFKDEDWWVLLKAPQASVEDNQYFLYVSQTFPNVIARATKCYSLLTVACRVYMCLVSRKEWRSCLTSSSIKP